MGQFFLLFAILSLFGTSLASAAEAKVDQIKEKFTKEELSLKVGDSLTFLNSDPVKHNLTVLTPDEESNDLGLEAPGSQVKYTFSKPGQYDVRCAIHPRMKMKVKVE